MSGEEEVPLSFVEINGATLAYRAGGDPQNPLIITLHGGRGFGTHNGDFKAMRFLRDRFRVVSFDYRGHGESSSTPPYTFAQIVDDIEAVRKHFNGNAKAIISGGSFGGFLAQQYALTHPNSLSHLILRGTAASHHHEAGAIANLKKLAATKAPQASVGMLNKVFGAFKDDVEMRLIMFAIGPLYVEHGYDPDDALEACRRTKYNSESHNSLYSEKEKYFDFRDRLEEIQVPTLIVVGAHDWVTPLENSVEIHEKIKNSTLVVFPDENHGVNRDSSKGFVEEIVRFCSSEK